MNKHKMTLHEGWTGYNVWPSKPWTRPHIDFAGPFKDSNFLIVVDSHTKWPEMYRMYTTTAYQTIKILKSLFACHAIPDQVVSDNGPHFIATKFEEFLRNNGIKHIRCSPYHHSSNRKAEKFVKSFIEAMIPCENDSLSLNHKIDNFLTDPHLIPQLVNLLQGAFWSGPQKQAEFN